jgi:hypothetical protein
MGLQFLIALLGYTLIVNHLAVFLFRALAWAYLVRAFDDSHE